MLFHLSVDTSLLEIQQESDDEAEEARNDGKAAILLSHMYI